MADLYGEVIGQGAAVDQLRAASRAPVHAYLFVGPPGTGKRAAALSFAASLLCERGGCGECETCRRVLAGIHPDLVVVERAGPFIGVEEARRVARLSVRTPMEASRQVLVLNDFHLVDKAAPVLLKSLEEPPATTVFVVLAEQVPAELSTIASRCVRIDFSPLDSATVAEVLESEGVGRQGAELAASASGGRLDRARLLAVDPGVAARREAWLGVPGRLDGTGATVMSLADELLEDCESALSPLRQYQQVELESLAVAAKEAGERGVPGRREVEERHRREQRRARTDELRFGLSVLEGSYRARLQAALADAGERPKSRAAVGACLEAIQTVDAAGQALSRNPNEALLLQALLLNLSELGPDVAAGPAGDRQFGEADHHVR